MPITFNADQAMTEFADANQLFADYVKAGYSQEDADALTREPVRQKWSALAQLPQSADPKTAARMAGQFDQAGQRTRDYEKAGYMANDAANMMLDPIQQESKIVAAGSRAQPAIVSPGERYLNSPRIAAEMDAYKRQTAQQPGDPVALQKQFPDLFKVGLADRRLYDEAMAAKTKAAAEKQAQAAATSQGRGQAAGMRNALALDDKNPGALTPQQRAEFQKRLAAFDVQQAGEVTAPPQGPSVNPAGPAAATPDEGAFDPSVGASSQPAERQAVGGYKVGATYKGGLKYLGGDPNDQASWERQ